MITRRDFCKLAALSTAALAFRPFNRLALPTFPQADRLGRITAGKWNKSYCRGESSLAFYGTIDTRG